MSSGKGHRTDEARSAAFDRLLRTPFPKEQQALREPLRQGDGYLNALASLFVQNPFFALTDSEADVLCEKLQPPQLAGLLAARHRAMRASAANPVVFCMPKSGSSFLKSALQEALQLPAFSLTGFGNAEVSSHFGMNGREQEIDELALVKASLLAPQGFIAQSHTRYTAYLGLQIAAFRLRPIVTLRNILDSLVSFDDMMMAGRAAESPHAWLYDTQFALPRDYGRLALEARLRVLGPSLGVWLIQFHLSWRRCREQGLISPLVVRYEEDVLDPPRLVARLAEALGLDPAQVDRLEAFVARPDRELSRLNVGQAGRGRERVPPDVRQPLVDYARIFDAEIPADDIAYLLD